MEQFKRYLEETNKLAKKIVNRHLDNADDYMANFLIYYGARLYKFLNVNGKISDKDLKDVKWYIKLSVEEGVELIEEQLDFDFF